MTITHESKYNIIIASVFQTTRPLIFDYCSHTNCDTVQGKDAPRGNLLLLYGE